MAGFAKGLQGMSANSAGQQTIVSLNRLVQAKVNRDLVSEGSGDIDGLVKRAYNEVVGSNFNVVNGGKSSVLVPRRIGSYTIDDKEAKIFKTFMSVYSTPENLKALGVYVPPQNADGLEDVGKQQTTADWAHSQIGPNTDAGNESGASRYLRDMAERSRWVTNPTQTGLMLVMPTDRGGSEAVINKYGKPIEKSFEEIYMRPDKRVKEANKTIVTKLFGG
jgi:hypothetical protein